LNLKLKTFLSQLSTDAKEDTDLNQRRILLFSLLFLVCFLLVAYFKETFKPIDSSVNIWSGSINSGSFALSAQIISVVFDTTALVVSSVVLSILLFVFHQRRYGALLLGAMAGDALLVTLFKTVIMSSRPLNGIIIESGYSFPSGHTTSCVIFFGVITYFVWNQWRSFKFKASTAGLYVSVTAVVGFDRIYLNVHWFSDIIGAVLLGVFWLALCIFLFKTYLSKSSKSNWLMHTSRDHKA
jgi:undecaprenyl-diphosphatase